MRSLIWRPSYPHRCTAVCSAGKGMHAVDNIYDDSSEFPGGGCNANCWTTLTLTKATYIRVTINDVGDVFRSTLGCFKSLAESRYHYLKRIVFSHSITIAEFGESNRKPLNNLRNRDISDHVQCIRRTRNDFCEDVVPFAMQMSLYHNSPQISRCVCLSVFANCRSQLLIDRLVTYIKLFVSTVIPSSHEFASQFGLAI